MLVRIAVRGWSDIPVFRVSGNTVHLKTSYNAVVDGTSGDTYLVPVFAAFGKSKILARGKVAGVKGRKGKAVVLDVVVTEARVEDMLNIAVPSDEPALEGPIQFTTKFHLPPGDEDVIEKLQLDGTFGLTDSKFSEKVQDKMDDFSQRAKGKPDQEAPKEVAADFNGQFHMANGKIAFPRIEFEIPGANVTLAGDYGMRSKELDFQGHLLMQAKISEAVTGVKSVFLKLVDPFFRDKGKTSIPIKISGKVGDPKFGLKLGGAEKVAKAEKK
jgi:hypothetical protein